MISIGERVKRAIDDMGRGEFMFALEQVSIAIDMTAKNHYKKTSSSGERYKNLLKEYSWLLELMSLPGINLDESKFGNFPFKDSGNKEYHEPNFQDLMYNVVRCGLIHGENSNLRFHQDNTIYLGKDILILPIRIVWGLLGIVVFCVDNKSEKTADGYFLSILEQRFTINGWWGMEEIIRMRYKERTENNPRMKLNIIKEHFYPLPADQKN